MSAGLTYAMTAFVWVENHITAEQRNYAHRPSPIRICSFMTEPVNLNRKQCRFSKGYLDILPTFLSRTKHDVSLNKRVQNKGHN